MTVGLDYEIVLRNGGIGIKLFYFHKFSMIFILA